MNIKKIDGHMHLSLIPDKIGPYGLPIGTFEQMVPVYKILGIEKSILLPGTNESQLTSDDACKLSQQYPDQIAWLCNLEPDGTDKTFEKLKHYKQNGARGVGEFALNLRLDNPIIEHLLGCCEALEMPFLFHMSPKENYSYGIVDFIGLPLLERVLQKYPNLIVVGHSSPFWFEINAYPDPDKIPIEERNGYPAGRVTEGRLQELLRKYPNLYGDLSANSGGNALMRDPDYAIAFMEEFQDRLIFGTDLTSYQFVYPLAPWLDLQYRSRRISETVYRKICRENAERIYKI